MEREFFLTVRDFPFKDIPEQRRQVIFSDIWLKYGASMVPVILASNDFELLKKRFIIPQEMPVAHFIHKLRINYIHNISPPEAIFLFTTENTIPSGKKTMGQVAQRHRDIGDGFLYLLLVKENTFGSRLQ